MGVSKKKQPLQGLPKAKIYLNISYKRKLFCMKKIYLNISYQYLEHTKTSHAQSKLFLHTKHVSWRGHLIEYYRSVVVVEVVVAKLGRQ